MTDDRMGPDVALGIANSCLRSELEPAMLVPTLRGSLNQRHRSAAFLQAIEHAIGARHGTFAESPIVPHFFTSVEILANPGGISMSVKIISHQDDAAVMVFHHFILVD